ncbi:Sterigmatocystin biosynthesis regulatory protein [Hondaea fermentalgiana]|uniref:Sterigmatocystin biosynthesis regulatory protein n=1 Tax=Hondaea fermentalgiana TaxID=2315210 RepID=A0A2R5GJS6_9STRA|nr:Sterigmatocystin biosynthesis regulatory protein [Hondaea fermentalgiana]|eukprot:GBG28114.1 Sterigmatocystin biosynthesis regulatory protein [Hondaea fermentalgiana]
MSSSSKASSRKRHGSLQSHGTGSVDHNSSAGGSTSSLSAPVVEAPPTMKRTCENCTRVKVKCEGYPICKRCERRGMECVFREQHKRGRKRQPEYFAQQPMQPYQVVSGGQTYIIRPGTQNPYMPQSVQQALQHPQQQHQGSSQMLNNFNSMPFFGNNNNSNSTNNNSNVAAGNTGNPAALLSGFPQSQQQQHQLQQPSVNSYAYPGAQNMSQGSIDAATNVSSSTSSGTTAPTAGSASASSFGSMQLGPGNASGDANSASGPSSSLALTSNSGSTRSISSTNNNNNSNAGTNANHTAGSAGSSNNSTTTTATNNPFLPLQSQDMQSGGMQSWIANSGLSSDAAMQILLQQQQQTQQRPTQQGTTMQGQHMQQQQPQQQQQQPNFFQQPQQQQQQNGLNPMMMMWMNPQNQQQFQQQFQQQQQGQPYQQQLQPQQNLIPNQNHMPATSLPGANLAGLPFAMSQQMPSNQQFLAGLQRKASRPVTSAAASTTTETRKRSSSDKISRKRNRESPSGRTHHHKHHHHYHGHNSSQFRRQRDSGGSSGSEEETERQNRPDKRQKGQTTPLANESPSSEERISSLSDPLRRILVVFLRLLGPQMQDRYFRILAGQKGDDRMPRFASIESSRSTKATRFFFSTLIRFFSAKGDSLTESVTRKWADKLQYIFTSRDPSSRLATTLAREDPASGEMYVGPRVSRPYQSANGSGTSEDDAVPFSSAVGSGSGPGSGESSGSFSGSVEGVSSNSGGENQAGSDRDSGSNSNSNELRRDLSPGQRSPSPPGTPVEIEERHFRLKETPMSSGLAWLLGSSSSNTSSNSEDSLEHTRTPLFKIACLWRHSKSMQGGAPYLSFVDINAAMKSMLGMRSAKQLLPLRGFCDGVLPYGLDPLVEMLVSPEEVTRFVLAISSKVENAVSKLRRPANHHGEQAGSSGSSGGSSGGVLGSSGSNSNNQSGSNSGSGNDTAAMVSADYSSSSSSHSGLGGSGSGSAGNGSGESNSNENGGSAGSSGSGRTRPKESNKAGLSRHHHHHHREAAASSDSNENGSGGNKASTGSTGSGTESAAGSRHSKSLNGSADEAGAKRSTKATVEASQQACAAENDSAGAKAEPKRRSSVEMLLSDMLHVLVDENGRRVPRLCRVSTLLRVTQVSISVDNLQVKMRAGKDFLLESVVTISKLEARYRDDAAANLLAKTAMSSLHGLPSAHDTKHDHIWLDEKMRLLLRPR